MYPGDFMQTHPSAIPAPVLGFQLPSLAAGIPSSAVVRHTQSNMAKLAINLVHAGVISHRDVPDTVTSAADVVSHSLSQWFTARTRNLKRVQFSVSIVSSEAATEFIQYTDGSDRKFHGEPVLVIDSPAHEEPYEMFSFASNLDAEGRKVLASALDAIGTASVYTVDIRTPLELFNEFCGWNWEGDWTEVPTEKEARRMVLERHGEEGDIKSYLPSYACPVFGYDLFKWTKKRPWRKQGWLRRHAKAHRGKVATVARETAILLDLLAPIRESKICMPDLSEIWIRPTTFAAALVYKDDPIVWETLDNMNEVAYNAGEACEMLGMAELPSTATDLKTYFNNLDTCLAVLRQMDKVMGLITTPVNPQGNPP
jgi:PRTRC genetic system protein F